VNKILLPLNFALGLSLALLIALGVKTWVRPPYPAQVDGASVMAPVKSVEPLSFARKMQDAGVINAAVQGNVFRQERTEYTPPPPVQVAVAPPPKPALPPPAVQLKGILVFGRKKIAILEGNYPVMEANNAIKNNPVKRKGYLLGDQIGDYELTTIGKSEVILDDKRGRTLNLKLVERPPDKAIRREGIALVQRSKNFNPETVVASSIQSPRPVAAPPAPVSQATDPVPTPRTFRISGAPTTGLPEGIPQPRISGR